jgi:CRP/FNR family transcriptional regulator, cyclic AMP receptor protein
MIVERSTMDTLTFRPSIVILYPGKPDLLYRVQSGLVRIHTMDNDGNSLTLRYVKPTEYFGEECLAQLSRSYFAESVTESVVDVIQPNSLSSDESMAVMVHLVKSLNRGYQTLYRLAGKRLRARIAWELLELASTALASTKPDGNLMVYATHDELAAAVGSVRETVTKVVGELARDGVIDAGYGKITLKDIATLKAIADD